MANSYFLDQPGLERLVAYINDALNNKVSKGEQVTLPENLVYAADLADYAKKSDIPEGQDLSEYAKSADFADVVRDSDISDVVRDSDIADVVREADLADYASADDLEDLRAEVTSLYHFKGSVADMDALLAIQNPHEGDVYNLDDSGINAAWVIDDQGNGKWDEFGGPVDFTDYWAEAELQALTIPEVDAILYGGKSAVVSDVAGLNAMLANDNTEVDVTLNGDLAVNSTITVPEGKKLNLDLGGNSLSASGVAVFADGGELVVSNGSVASSSNDAIVVRNGGSVTIDGANITSVRSNGVAATDGSITMNSGSVTSQEAGLLGMKNSTIVMNGGTITGIDNCPIMGNGSPAGSQNDGTNCNIVMNGGTLVAHMTAGSAAKGWTACGVYVPNSGSFTMNGGEIISDGAGIVMRAGEVELNGGSISANGTSGVKGKVGDSTVVVGPYAVVFDQKANYPGASAGEFVLTIGPDVILNGTDGALDFVFADSMDAAAQEAYIAEHFIDNRNP